VAENVASRALRGLGNALSLVGQRFAPPGIELALPSQPVHDLTQYARYGSSPIFSFLSDGWVSVGLSVTQAAGTFGEAAIADWSSVVSGDFGISQNSINNMALWVYHVSVQATVVATLADIGDVLVRVNTPRGINLNNGSNIVILFQSKAGNFVQESGVVTFLIDERKGFFPYQWAAGENLRFRVQNLNGAADDIAFKCNLLCRMVPLGVPPLP